MSLVLGLDIGASAIKAVLMEDGLHGEVVKNFYHHPYGNESRQEALNQFFKNEVIAEYDRLVVSCKGHEGSVRIVELPFKDSNKVRSVLPFELENEFADGVDDRVFRFHSIPARLDNSGSSHRFLSIGIYRSIIDDYRKLLSDLGHSPYLLDYDAYANFNCYAFKNSSSEENDHGIWLLVDVGAKSTGINIINKNELLYTRSVFFGGNDFTEAIASNFNLEFAVAEELKLEYGLQMVEEDFTEIDQVVSNCLDKLVQEIKLTLGSYYTYQGQHDIEGMILYGGGSNLKGLSDYIQQMLGFPVLFSDPLAQINSEASAPKSNNLYSIAIGLALRGIGEGRLRHNFLSKTKFLDLYEQKRLMMHSAALMIVGFLYFVCSGFEFAAVYLTKRTLNQEYQKETQQILSSQKNQNLYKTVGALHMKITERKRLLERFSSSVRSPLDILNFMSINGTKNMGVEFSSILLTNQDNQSVLRISGMVPGTAELRQFEAVLDRIPEKKTRELIKSNTNLSGDRLEFEQEIEL